MISCPFQTSFGQYTASLKTALEKTGNQVEWVASNCGCGDPMEESRQFQISGCKYFELPMPNQYRSRSLWKRWSREIGRSVMARMRAKRYAQLSQEADIVHFHQILNGYGSKVLFHWLLRPARTARIVTVHELDQDQVEPGARNLAYNRAGGIIVHCREMRDKLIAFGVRPEKIHVVLHGTGLPDLQPILKRQGIVFYGGHKIMSGKGLETALEAMAIVVRQLGPDAPLLKIHGHYGSVTPEQGLALARVFGVGANVVWLNQLPQQDSVELYRSSAMCILPYTGSFAGSAASLAAACALPVVGTRKAGLPDHLGSYAVWVPEQNADQLARQILALTANRALRIGLGVRLREHAERFLSWDAIADCTLQVYESALKNCQGVRRRLAVKSSSESGTVRTSAVPLRQPSHLPFLNP